MKEFKPLTLFDLFGESEEPELPKTIRTPTSEQLAQREEALDQLEDKRGALLETAKKAALRLVTQNGTVTSTEVFELLRKELTGTLLQELEETDPRFMGVVFRTGWVRVGMTSTGSHARPVSIWKRK